MSQKNGANAPSKPEHRLIIAASFRPPNVDSSARARKISPHPFPRPFTPHKVRNRSAPPSRCVRVASYRLRYNLPMTLLYADPRFLDHETGSHPECAARIRPIPARLERAGLLSQCRQVEYQPVSRQRLARVHSRHISTRFGRSPSPAGGTSSPTPLSAPPLTTWPCWRPAACATPSSASFAAKTRRPYAWSARPAITPWPTMPWASACSTTWPSRPERPSTSLGLDRVLIVDWDIHHGNGTQATFWEDPQVGFLSIHRWPFYPGTGDADETGGGPRTGHHAESARALRHVAKGLSGPLLR